MKPQKQSISKGVFSVQPIQYRLYTHQVGQLVYRSNCCALLILGPSPPEGLAAFKKTILHKVHGFPWYARPHTPSPHPLHPPRLPQDGTMRIDSTWWPLEVKNSTRSSSPTSKDRLLIYKTLLPAIWNKEATMVDSHSSQVTAVGVMQPQFHISSRSARGHSTNQRSPCVRIFHHISL